MPVSPSPRLRVATADDIETIRDLADRTWRACYPGIISEAQIDYMLGWMYSPEQIRSEIESGEIRYLLAEMADAEPAEPAGFAAFGPDPEDAAGAFLHKLYVLPERQRLGLGSALLAEVERLARTHGSSRLSLRVNRGNEPAIRAYEKNGFRLSHEVCSDIGGGFVMDDFVMVLDLAATGA